MNIFIVSSFGGEIDNSGAIILPEAVLFEQGKANISPQLVLFLKQVCGPWLTVLKNSGVPISEAMNQTGFTGERKAWKVSHDKRKFREPFFDRSAGA
ncbi:MAG: hypothetical protein ACI8Q6_002006, partial [Granulosicoccus sp.]